MSALIVPVYLNQKLVFDLLAMLEGGIATVTAVSRSQNSNSGSEEKLSTGFGLSEAFSTLLKINLSGQNSKVESDAKSASSSEERVHTPASMFFQLRNLLLEKQHLPSNPGRALPEAGSFVEFRGFLKRNPILETIDSLAEMMELAESFQLESNNPKERRGVPNFSSLRKQMMKFSESLKAGSTIDLTARAATSSQSFLAVITLETKFLNDPLMSDLVDGQFTVLGKVIRSVGVNEEPINLLRKTALSKMPQDVVSKALKHLSDLGKNQGFAIPALETSISGPAIQVIPLAIYT